MFLVEVRCSVALNALVHIRNDIVFRIDEVFSLYGRVVTLFGSLLCHHTWVTYWLWHLLQVGKMNSSLKKRFVKWDSKIYDTETGCQVLPVIWFVLHAKKENVIWFKAVVFQGLCCILYFFVGNGRMISWFDNNHCGVNWREDFWFLTLELTKIFITCNSPTNDLAEAVDCWTFVISAIFRVALE